MTDEHAILDVLSQYVRATDERDGDAQAKLFADDGMIRFFGRSGTEEYQLAGEPAIGAERIRRHMEGFPPRPARTYQHHITTDHLIRVNGAEATMNAQFLVFSSVAAPKPEDGWQAPPGAKGDITVIMIGYYDSDLRKIDGVWKLTRLDVKHSLPVFRAGLGTYSMPKLAGWRLTRGALSTSGRAKGRLLSIILDPQAEPSHAD